jgi:hypothetical protein
LQTIQVEREPFSISPLGKSLTLTFKHSMETLDGDKSSSLLRTFVNYDRKKFNKIETGNDNIRLETLEVAKVWSHFRKAAPGIREGHARHFIQKLKTKVMYLCMHYLSVRPSVRLSVRPSVRPSLHPSVCRSVGMPVHLLNCLSLNLCLCHLSVCLSIY